MSFELEPTSLRDVYVAHSQVFTDGRGFFKEVFRQDVFESLGLPGAFLQMNQSGSVKGVVRGLHFQWDRPMSKLMWVVRGEAMLVAADIRKNSPTFKQWVGVVCSDSNHKRLIAPAGCARGFCVLSDYAEIQYLCTATYNPAGESGIRWNDPDIGVEWPVSNPILSPKDASAQSLSDWLARPESDTFLI